MPETNISSTDYGNLSNTQTSYTKDTAPAAFTFKVDAVNTDAAGDNKETEWTNSFWATYLGYYKSIPELMAAIDAKATWTVGKGFKADPFTTLKLMNIKGNGVDTFNTILENAVRTYHIGGDAFIEIIRDKGELVNLKPLDPGSMKIVANRQGLIIRYEQISKVKMPNKKFAPEDILHLSRNRVADEIHGVSLIPAIEQIILMRNEAMSDMKTLMHRHVKPINVFKLDTDDVAKIAAFKAKADAATDKGENLFIPKGAVEHELVSVPANATLNPLPWIQQLNQYFFQATGVPQIIVGGSQEMTEASAKIAYLAFEQTIEEEQLYIEEQILSQLNLEIELSFPATLQNELLSDNAKDGAQNIDQADTQAQPTGPVAPAGVQ
jgi:hypothetical protein